MEYKIAKERYNSLTHERDLYLNRARDVSKLTLPTLFPEDYFSKSAEIRTPYQSLGARACNNLSSKLLLALLPPNTPFFKFSIDDVERANIEFEDSELATQIAEGLSLLEQRIVSEIESSQLRVAMYQAFLQLIISGNALLHLEDLDNIRVFKLTNYVLQRDVKGNILEIVIKETLAKSTLPEDILAMLTESASSNNSQSEVDIYTCIKRISKDKYMSFKEVEDQVISDSVTTYKTSELPYLPLRFNRIDGENYGRGYAEEYLGDLVSLEGLTKALVEGAQMSAKMILLTSPAGTVTQRQLAKANNGDVLVGNADDVSVIRIEKTNDFRFALDTAAGIQQRLSGVFLLNSSIQRDAERVTAEEIRLMARELEEALGGIYTVMSQEFQLPLINIIISVLVKKNKMPKLPKDYIKISISTGLEALGRGHDLQKLNTFIGTLAQLGEGAMSYVNMSNYIERVALSLGLNTQGLIKTQEQLMQEQQQAFEQSPEMVNQTGQLMKAELENELRQGE